MNLISETVCPEDNHAREVLVLAFKNMQRGDILVMQSRADGYHVILMGNR